MGVSYSGKRPNRKQLLLCISLIIIWTTPLFIWASLTSTFGADFADDPRPSFELTPLDPISEPNGHRISQTPFNSMNSVVIMNETLNYGSPFWVVEPYTSLSAIVNNTLGVTDGVLNIVHSNFRTTVMIPYEDYDGFSVTLNVSCVVGMVSVYFRVSIDGRNSEYYSSDLEHIERIELEGGQNASLHIVPIMSDLDQEPGEWLVPMTVHIGFNAETLGQILEPLVTIEASSSHELVPLTIDVQTQEGESIYKNPNTQHLMLDPMINLTRNTNGTPRYARFTAHRVNETIYTRPTNMNFTASWLYRSIYSNFWRYDSSFTLANETSTFIEVEFPLTELHISFAPEIPYFELRLDYNSDMHFYWWLYLGSRSSDWKYVYIPLIEGNNNPQSFIIEIRAFTYENTIGQYYYRSIAYFSMDTNTNWHLNISYAQIVTLGNIVLTYEGLVASVGLPLWVITGLMTLIVTILYISNPSREDFKRFLLKPEVIPFLLVTLSIFVPWITSDEYIQSFYQGGTAYRDIYPALNTVITHSNDTLATIRFGIYPHHVLSIHQFWWTVEILFWITWIYLVIRIAVPFGEHTYLQLMSIFWLLILSVFEIILSLNYVQTWHFSNNILREGLIILLAAPIYM
ncbi:MAG: hypothetical protein ACFFEM_01310, partial [Candidatus Thorarchaeota archaeon]